MASLQTMAVKSSRALCGPRGAVLWLLQRQATGSPMASAAVPVWAGGSGSSRGTASASSAEPTAETEASGRRHESPREGCGPERIGTEAQRYGLRQGQPPPLLRPFDLTPADAWQRFEAWQAASGLLSPRGLLGSKSGASLTPELLPFWVFEATLRVRHQARLKYQDKGPNGPETESLSEWSQPEERRLASSDGDMQIYASYKYRRDLADSAKGNFAIEDCRNLKAREVHSHMAAGAVAQQDGGGQGTDVSLEPASMRQSIAWQLAIRNAVATERVRALRRVREAHPDASAVGEVQVQAKVLRRSARLVHLPVFTATYTFGKQVSPDSGENEDEHFQTVISGWAQTNSAGEGHSGVAAEPHFSSRRAQLAVAGSAAGLGLAAEVVNPILGMDFQVFVFDNAYLGAIALAVASLGARVASQMQRQQHHQRLKQSEEYEAATASATGLGPMDLAEPHELQAVCDTEWSRWEEVNKWDWNPVDRQAWAEGLFRRQHRRVLEQAAFRLRLDEETRQHAKRAAQEARREAKWGKSSHHRHFDQHGHQIPGRNAGGGRSDFKGYFKLLGLDGKPPAELKDKEIKSAFRSAAMECHPDKQAGKGEQDRAAASERFKKLQKAYEVLKDPKRRRAYMSGQMTEEVF